MKTTSYSISKKLAEIGFECKNPEDRVWRYSETLQKKWEFPAYELETLLDTLPKKIGEEYDFTLRFTSYLEAAVFSYENWRGKVLEISREEIEVESEKNESLADTAAKLLLKLHEQGIINFEKR